LQADQPRDIALRRRDQFRLRRQLLRRERGEHIAQSRDREDARR
jgi:hypothetical protein